DCSSMPTRRMLMKTKALLLAALLMLTASMAAQADDKGASQHFNGATAWLNTPPQTLSDLRGKVVLVDFWTYTCINWRRTMPHVRAWAEKYKDSGLVVIGVHTPEFPFEKDFSNVQRAVKEMQITFPVALDSDYRVWRAFENQAWPALYLIDAQG